MASSSGIGPLSAIGPKRTFERTHSASLSALNRTCRCALHMSAFDPKRTLVTYIGVDRAERSWTSVQLASLPRMGNDYEISADPKGKAIGPPGGVIYGKRTEAVLKSSQRS